jgi:hypothetical protein
VHNPKLTTRYDGRWPQGLVGLRHSRIVKNARLFIATSDGQVAKIGWGDLASSSGTSSTTSQVPGSFSSPARTATATLSVTTTPQRDPTPPSKISYPDSCSHSTEPPPCCSTIPTPSGTSSGRSASPPSTAARPARGSLTASPSSPGPRDALGQQPNLSKFAFTATPKAKTLELFGTKTGQTVGRGSS